MAYNGETRRLFVGLDNGTISVSIHLGRREKLKQLQTKTHVL